MTIEAASAGRNQTITPERLFERCFSSDAVERFTQRYPHIPTDAFAAEIVRFQQLADGAVSNEFIESLMIKALEDKQRGYIRGREDLVAKVVLEVDPPQQEPASLIQRVRAIAVDRLRNGLNTMSVSLSTDVPLPVERVMPVHEVRMLQQRPSQYPPSDLW